MTDGPKGETCKTNTQTQSSRQTGATKTTSWSATTTCGRRPSRRQPRLFPMGPLSLAGLRPPDPGAALPHGASEPRRQRQLCSRPLAHWT
eukprot:7592587-Lingulodinium_polyedra.AAC.1